MGEPLPEREAALVEDQIGNNMERLYTRTDPLAVTLFDKVFGWICLVGLAALLALLIIDLVTERRCDYPEGYLYGLLFFAVGALDAFVPKVIWSLENSGLAGG